jgi:hypothetical protein
MTPEEIQAIRNKYKYDPSILNTGSNNPSLNSAISLSDFAAPEVAPEKTTGQKVAAFAGEVVKPFERLGQGVLNATAGNIVGKKAQNTGLFGNTVDTLGYRDGQALQGSELAKDVVGNILDVGSYAVPVGTGAKVLTKVAKGVQAGAISGAMTGVGQALQEGQTIPESIGQGLAYGAGGAVIGGVIPGGVSTVKSAYNKLNPSEKFIESQIVKEFTKGVKPVLPGKTTPSLMNKYNDNVVTAVKTIKSNKDKLNFSDETGEIISGQTPKNISQLNDAVEQTKKTIFTQYDELAKKAGAQGVTVDVTPIANELDSIIGNKALSISNPNAVQYAQGLKERLAGVGKIDAQTAQDVVQNYNKSLEAFYRNPTYDNASHAAIDSVVANNMRKALDDGISGITGSEYQALKNQYGALKSIERDVIKASLKEARKNAKGLIDFTDIFSGGQVVQGLASMNPAMVASGATQKAIASLYKHINDPNRAISKMFDAADTPVGGLVKKLSKNPRGMIDFGAMGRAFTSSEKNIVKAGLEDLKLAKSENGRMEMLKDVKDLFIKEKILSKASANNSDIIEEAALRSLEDSNLVLDAVKKKEMSTPMVKKVNDRFIKNPTTGKLEGSSRK